MANQVLSRPMFKQSQIAPTSSGIGGMTTPDQNAQALKNMFAPQIPATRPTQSFPVPQAMYKRGGEVIDGVAHFEGGDEVVARNLVPEIYRQNESRPVPAQQDPGANPPPETAAPALDVAPPAAAPAAPPADIPDRVARELLAGRRAPPVSAPSTSNVPVQREIETSEAGQRAIAKISAGRTGRNPGLVQEGFADLQRLTDEAYARSNIPASSTEEAARRVSAGIGTLDPTMASRMEDIDRNREIVQRPATTPSVVPPSPANTALGTSATPLAPTAPPPALPPGPQELQLESIRARREQSEKDREQNKYMALLSAGLGMMGGTSKNAFANIGAGGQQGIATFAGLEKARREDEATRRHEDILKAQMDQQMQITKMHLAQDPEQVRVYKALGGGDLVKGFQLVSSDKILEAAVKLSADYTADPAKRQNAQNYVNQRIQESSGARPGAASGVPSGSPVIDLSALGTGKR